MISNPRFFIPGDVMTLLAVSLAKASDGVLVVARSLRGFEVTEDTVAALTAINASISRMEMILRAVVEENPKEGISNGRA